MDGPTLLKLELHWRRLEDAKLQLDHCHNYIKEIRQDIISGVVLCADRNYDHLHGLKDEELAIGRYLRALNDYKAALLSQKSIELTSPEVTANAGNADGFGITPREREVLSLIASGKSNREIARELGIAFKTVVTHRYRLFRKLSVHNSADLTRIAIRMGLVDL